MEPRYLIVIQWLNLHAKEQATKPFAFADLWEGIGAPRRKATIFEIMSRLKELRYLNHTSGSYFRRRWRVTRTFMNTDSRSVEEAYELYMIARRSDLSLR